MPTPLHYRATVHRLACLADPSRPAYIAVAAAGALARVLSPANPRHRIIQQMLQAADAFELARHKLRDLYDREPAVPASEHGLSCDARIEEEELSEEDDDPL